MRNERGEMVKAPIETAMAIYSAEYLSMIASKYGGDATVNEIRVMNCIIRAHFCGRNIGVTCVAESLDIPKSTVSRAVLKLRSRGWLRESLADDDGRRRHLRLTEKMLHRHEVDIATLKARWQLAA